MQWENLTAPDFAAAVQETQRVCLLPMACIEKHGNHLPLGTDLFTGMEIARRAAAIEPVIVFPPFYFTKILEAKHQPGTIALGGRLMFDLLEAVCDEIGRNGLEKIILWSAHGGNSHFGPHFVSLTLDKQKDYIVYWVRLDSQDPEYQRLLQELIEARPGGHAGEMETSCILAICPELVKMDQVDDVSWSRKGRLDHLKGVTTSVGWYANYPNHWAGDPRSAAAEKGEPLLQYQAQRVAEAIRAIKVDEVTEELYKEFFGRSQH